MELAGLKIHSTHHSFSAWSNAGFFTYTSAAWCVSLLSTIVCPALHACCIATGDFLIPSQQETESFQTLNFSGPSSKFLTCQLFKHNLRSLKVTPRWISFQHERVVGIMLCFVNSEQNFLSVQSSSSLHTEFLLNSCRGLAAKSRQQQNPPPSQVGS